MAKNDYVAQMQALFDEAERLLSSGDLGAATAKYMALLKNTDAAPLAMYRLAQISNRQNDPLAAKNLYYQAFSARPDLCKNILAEQHANHNYVFRGRKDEIPQPKCPLCGRAGTPHWCYPVIEMAGAAYAQQYNPIRMWMHCEKCHHLYAEEFPEQKVIMADAGDAGCEHGAMPTLPHLFPHYSAILNKLAEYTKGSELLEVGIGGSECALVAREMGFHVFGVDISGGNVMQARRYGLDACQQDFSTWETDRKWDIIILGDVIEHVSDPVQAMKKVVRLLNGNGVIWISTPNFEAAFSAAAGDGDPMRREASHKNYFSRRSLYKLLQRIHLSPVAYSVSPHYNGSMEVVVVMEGENR